MTISDARLDKLEQIARKAGADWTGATTSLTIPERRHLSAFDPPTVLALISEVHGSRTAIAHLHKDLEWSKSQQDGAIAALSAHRCGEGTERAMRRAVEAEAELAAVPVLDVEKVANAICEAMPHAGGGSRVEYEAVEAALVAALGTSGGEGRA